MKRVMPRLCGTAFLVCLSSLMAAGVRAESNATEYRAWAQTARAGCEKQAGSGAKQDTAKFHRCMVDEHRAAGWVAQDRAERCHDKSGSFWGNRPGEREESEWQCLDREGRKAADSGNGPKGAAALARHASPERAQARRPACELWARDHLPPETSHLTYVATCMYAAGSPAAVGAAMKLGGESAGTDRPILQDVRDTPEREANRAWCAAHNAGGRSSGLLRYDCQCVDQATAREQRGGQSDRAAILARRFDLSACVDRAASGERAVADMGGRSLSRLFESEDDISKRENCYRSAVRQQLKAADLANDASLRAALEKRCR